MINRSQCKIPRQTFSPAVRHTNGTFDLVEITSALSILSSSLPRFIFSEIRYEKNEVSRIYVIRFMAWKWNEMKKVSWETKAKNASYLEGNSYFRILCIFLFRNLGCLFSEIAGFVPVDTVKYWDWDDIVKTVQAFALAMLTFVPLRDFYGGSNSSSIRVL